MLESCRIEDDRLKALQRCFAIELGKFERRRSESGIEIVSDK